MSYVDTGSQRLKDTVFELHCTDKLDKCGKNMESWRYHDSAYKVLLFANIVRQSQEEEEQNMLNLHSSICELLTNRFKLHTQS